MESWSGAMECSLGVDFEVERSQIWSYCCPSWKGFDVNDQFLVNNYFYDALCT